MALPSDRNGTEEGAAGGELTTPTLERRLFGGATATTNQMEQQPASPPAQAGGNGTFAAMRAAMVQNMVASGMQVLMKTMNKEMTARNNAFTQQQQVLVAPHQQ